MEVQRIAAFFVKGEVFAFDLRVLGFAVNHFHHAVEAAEPIGNCCLQIYQDAVMIAGCCLGANGDRVMLAANAVGV